jgi:hypothetical protein
MKIKLPALAAATALLAMSGLAQAGLLWGNNASYNGVIEAVDQSTLAVVHQYSVQAGNGRSVVVVGDIVYYTFVGDSHIYKLDANTGAALGSINTAAASMSTLAWDGSGFWSSDYSGTNKAFRIDINGNIVKTITLGNATDNMDGMEYFNGKLISNRGDAFGIYDVYDLDGNLLQASFITSHAASQQSTGIAFDGTDFLISDIFENTISRFDGTTGSFIDKRSITGPTPGNGVGQRLWEDLSVDYAVRSDTAVPEPSSAALAALAMLALGAASRRRA